MNEPVFDVVGGVHPVVASIQQGTFVSNDCHMGNLSDTSDTSDTNDTSDTVDSGGPRLWIATGPNMGGNINR